MLPLLRPARGARIGSLKKPFSIDETPDALVALDGGPRHPPGGKPQRLRSVDRMPPQNEGGGGYRRLPALGYWSRG